MEAKQTRLEAAQIENIKSFDRFIDQRSAYRAGRLTEAEYNAAVIRYNLACSRYEDALLAPRS